MMQHSGFGIKAHRVIKSACEVIGIKDLEVVIDGEPGSYIHILKSFLLGLLRMKTHQEIVDEKKLILAEIHPKTGYPKVRCFIKIIR